VTPGEFVSFRTGDGVRLDGFVVDRRPPGNRGGADSAMILYLHGLVFSSTIPYGLI